MIPPLIVEQALQRGIDWIAITDHNATANIQAVQQAAAGSALVVFPGMEVQTAEDVHVLCIFDSLEQITAWQDIVDQALPGFPNSPEYFGEQFIVDSTGDFLARDPRLLLTSTSLTLSQVYQEVSRLDGLFIPAHVDRQAFGLLATLGFVPADIKVDALEISLRISLQAALEKHPQLSSYPLIHGSDAHLLEDLLGPMEFRTDGAKIAEIRLALQNKAGRSHNILS
jgi:hypothetical protein